MESKASLAAHHSALSSKFQNHIQQVHAASEHAPVVPADSMHTSSMSDKAGALNNNHSHEPQLHASSDSNGRARRAAASMKKRWSFVVPNMVQSDTARNDMSQYSIHDGQSDASANDGGANRSTYSQPHGKMNAGKFRFRHCFSADGCLEMHGLISHDDDADVDQAGNSPGAELIGNKETHRDHDGNGLGSSPNKQEAEVANAVAYHESSESHILKGNHDSYDKEEMQDIHKGYKHSRQ